MRKSGILMPVFSLPSDFAIGTFGKQAYNFINFLKNSGQKIWQVLPLCPADRFASPYQSVSCFAGNPLFIDGTLLYEEGLLEADEVEITDKDKSRVDYPLAAASSERMLRRAFKKFCPVNFEPDYTDFITKNAFWLNDYAVFSAICDFLKSGSESFPPLLYKRDKTALEDFSKAHKEEIDYYIFVQFLFFRQWNSLKKYANSNGIEIFGDMPIYAASGSVDIWAHRKCFMLDENGNPAFKAGTPPDAFSRDGQLWGCPLYDFEYLKECDEPYYWWIERIRHAIYMYDTVRIDHFRAFDEFFAIPATDKTAINGRWIKGPSFDFFAALETKLGKNLPIVAEDLGIITDSVRDLLKKTGFAGMRVLQFAFDGNKNNPYLPYNYEKNSVAYIGTHDNAPLYEWKEENPDQAKRLTDYIGKNNEDLNWATIRLLESSAADTVIITMQDIMGTGRETRINTPGTTDNNWEWRIDSSCINPWLEGILKDYTEKYGR